MASATQEDVKIPATVAASESKKGKKVPVDRSVYQHPLNSRYCSEAMTHLWSDVYKFTTWRKLWIALATAEKELGLPITDAQIEQMKAKISDIDYDYAEKKEAELRHDVMSHIHTFGIACPEAQGIIHLGATSCFITDNTELIQMRESMRLVQAKLIKVISAMKEFALRWKDLPTLAFTHYQPAQLTTVGKRMCLWLQDFLMDFQAIKQLADTLPFRGAKGTTGTQASFIELFSGDQDKVKRLDARVTELMGFSSSLRITGQTYTRKIDYQVLSALSGLAQSAHKMSTDIRLLMNLKEIEEPFEKNQVGSSAMAYKRNPMRSERVCALARHVISLAANPAHTHATQWFERTLDDSANRRMALPEAFLGVDAILTIVLNVVSGLQVWPLVIRKHVMAELPFMATENILMECVKAGGDRQLLHEAIRELSMQAGRRVKEEGADNDLLERIARDERFQVVHDKLSTITDPSKFVGRAPNQVTEFVEAEVEPVLAANTLALDASQIGSVRV